MMTGASAAQATEQADQAPDASGGERTFDVVSPATGKLLGTYPIHSPQHIGEVVERAHEAADWWARLTFAQRGRRIDAFRGIVARRFSELAQVVSDETGKPLGDAGIELVTILDHMAWAAKNAPRILGQKRRGSGLMSFHLKGTVEYRPYGVVGVIGPWNFPVMTPLGSIIFALAASNAVVFEPSEFTPGVGAWLVKHFNQAVPEHPVLQLVTGDGSTGAALTASNIDKIAFTGSTATAKKVMGGAAGKLTPVVAECGGKDALIVDYDANVDAAVDAAVWTSFANAGQVCVGTERIYVHASVYDEFTRKFAAQVNTLRAGADAQAPIGPITMPSQLGVIAGQVKDALSRGATVLASTVTAGSAVGEAQGQVVQPAALTDVPHDTLLNQQETFGPVVTVGRFETVDEVLSLVNGTIY